MHYPQIIIFTLLGLVVFFYGAWATYRISNLQEANWELVAMTTVQDTTVSALESINDSLRDRIQSLERIQASLDCFQKLCESVDNMHTTYKAASAVHRSTNEHLLRSWNANDVTATGA